MSEKGFLNQIIIIIIYLQAEKIIFELAIMYRFMADLIIIML
jgi:hypothetical protein